MDLNPFLRINPCGYAGLEMTQLNEFDKAATVESVAPALVKYLAEAVGYKQWQSTQGWE
jgi:lipoyl(octanoyl) transferase